MTKGTTLTKRITELKKNALAVVVLPGGPATQEELWNAIVGVAEGGKLLTTIPTILVNIDGFYNDTIQQLDIMAKYFYWPKYKNYIMAVSNMDELMSKLDSLRYMKKIK